jgi:hypothetical protein
MPHLPDAGAAAIDIIAMPDIDDSAIDIAAILLRCHATLLFHYFH